MNFIKLWREEPVIRKGYNKNPNAVVIQILVIWGNNNPTASDTLGIINKLGMKELW